MKRTDLAGLVSSLLPNDSVVVCGLGSTSIAWRGLETDVPTYYTSDPMGLGPSVALGVALSNADSRVTLLQGDGELLLTLGSLVTISNANPGNLRIVVFHNQHYETGGRRPLPTGGHFDLARMARGAGFENVWAATADERIEESLHAMYDTPGLGILVATIESEGFTYGTAKQKSPTAAAAEFRKGLGEES